MKTLDIRPLPSRPAIAAVLAVGLLVATGSALAHKNPVDPISNPQGLEFSNVEMELPDYAPPFQRDGQLEETRAAYNDVQPGMTQPQIRTLLGKPLNAGAGSEGAEWNYNFTLVLPTSTNYIVCQYKVVFDDDNRVKAGVWRRNQCLDIARNQQPTG